MWSGRDILWRGFRSGSCCRFGAARCEGVVPIDSSIWTGYTPRWSLLRTACAAPWTLLLVAAVLSPIAGAAEPGISVQAPGQLPVHLSVEDLAALNTLEVSVQDERGNPARYRGVRVAEVLAKAGAPLPVLRGKVMTESLLVNAADGYAVIFALPELDADFTAAQVLVCFERDGHALSDEEGPIRIVVPNEKKHARWVRRAVELAIQPGVKHEN